MLTLDKDWLSFSGPSQREAGTVRYSPPFAVSVLQVKLVGYLPRLVLDDESDFLVLVDRQGVIYYINTGLLTTEEADLLAATFAYDLDRDTPSYDFEDCTRGLSTVVYPANLRGQPLFKPWSWFSPRGFLKNLSYRLGMDKPMWERLTDDMRPFLAQP